MKQFLLSLLALCFCFEIVLSSSSIKGIVSPIRRCGGVGTFRQLRISGCEGYCELTPGQVYEAEQDFAPSSASPSLSLRVDVCIEEGFCYNIIEAVLENSSVQPGFLYTAKFQIVPNDILSGKTIGVQSYIYHTDIERIETCIEMDVDIL